MKKLTDQELDSLFKNAAEGFKPTFDQAAWEAMNTRLDQPKPTLWKRWMPFTLLGLTTFFIGVWIGSFFGKEDKLSYSQPVLDRSELSQSVTEPQIHQQNTLSQESAIEQSIDNGNQVGSRRINNDKPFSIKSDVSSNSTYNKNTVTNEYNAKFSSVDDKVVNENPALLMNSHDPIDRTELLNQGQLIELKDSLQEISEAIMVNDTTQSVSEMNEEERSVSNARSFNLRLLASPDFSSIDYSSSNTTGSNYAILFDYQFSNHWSISTGGIWSLKKYSTDQEVTYGQYTADSMIGACRVLDIPINVYYRFFPQAKFSFYTGVGFSSYIMLEEDYTYTFNYPSGSQNYSFNFEKKNNEWFKMLNVSLGVQYQLSNRTSLQAEPFLKAPLQGIGEWDVNLSSMGVFMGMKYRIY